MPRKHKHEEHENHERWLVSYADFITLLFAFFVVMYSVSSVNEGKFRTVSSSIKAALRPIVSPLATKNPFKLGDHKADLIAPKLKPSAEHVYRELRQALESLPGGAEIGSKASIKETGRGIVITLQDSVVFEPGEATVLAGALPFLKALGEVLAEYGRVVTVEGHTDNVPIRTAAFPSNWELASARAVVVVRLLSDVYGVAPENISAASYAEYRPVAENATPEGRAKNRRVEIVISDPWKDHRWF